MINRRFRGVEVLRGFLVLIVQTPGTKTNSCARNIADWPHQPSTETVIKSAITPSRQTGSFDLLIGEALGTKVARQCVPRGRRVADPKVAAHRFIKAPASQKLTPKMRFGGSELCLIKLLSHAVRIKKALAPPRLLAAKSPTSRGLVTQSNAGFEGQGFHGLGKGKRINFLDKADDVSAFAAAKTVPKPLRGTNVERGRAFIMKWAQSLQRINTRRAQCDSLADDFFNARGITYGGDVFFEDQAGHEFSLASGHFLSRGMCIGTVPLIKAGRTASHIASRASVKLRYLSARRLGR